MRVAVETVGATRCFLPKYSPDLNPIELCFAKLQTILRVARCRAREELWATIGACVPVPCGNALVPSHRPVPPRPAHSRAGT